MDLMAAIHQEQPRKKLTRAKVPKVRTGCITCKRRHLKCDEANPSCLRCLKDRFKCDGYEQRQLHLPYNTENMHLFMPETQTNLDEAIRPPHTFLRPALADGIGMSSIDNALYYHARQWVIPDLEMAGGMREIWHDVILPLSHTNKPLKYALCALGASHQRFLASYPGHFRNITHSTDYDYQASQKYSQAISFICPVMAENKRLNLKVTLLSCTIFICIENLQRRYADSVRHLRAGYQLLDHLSTTIESQNDNPDRKLLDKNAQDDRKLIGGLSKMFSSLSKNVAAFTGDESFPQIKSVQILVDMGNPDEPFASLDEAEDSLSAINTVSDSLLLRIGTEEDYLGPMAVVADPLEALEVLKPPFRIWNSRLQLLESSNQFKSPNINNARRLALLSLFQTTWSAFLQMGSVDPGFQRQDYHTILDKILKIVLLDNIQSRPSFTFDGHLICELSTICASCQDIEVRTKALEILRMMRRREGIWDSWEVANVYERMFRALESKRLSWDGLPWGFVQLSKSLSP